MIHDGDSVSDDVEIILLPIQMKVMRKKKKKKKKLMNDLLWVDDFSFSVWEIEMVDDAVYFKKIKIKKLKKMLFWFMKYFLPQIEYIELLWKESQYQMNLCHKQCPFNNDKFQNIQTYIYSET